MDDLSLPDVLPVFPLSGVLLLPGNLLPLHIFEPRYRNMVEDALAGGLTIGMIQPARPDLDNLGEAREERPELRVVGCAGRIVESARLAGGRFLIVLRGERRFRIAGELPPFRGYRLVEADYRDFAVDRRELDEAFDASALLDALRSLGARGDHLRKLAALPGLRQLHIVAATLPFAPDEKQALLEAVDAVDRQRILLTLLQMGALGASEDETPSTVH